VGSARARRRRLRAAALSITVAGGLLAVPAGPWDAAAAAAPVTVGFRDHSYAGTTAPTAEKPQSKVWFHDGAWFGVLFRTTQPGPPATGNFYIWRLDPVTQTWVDTGTLVDTRSDVNIDMLADGNALYAVSSSGSPNPARDRKVKVWGFTYDSVAKTYNLSGAFPAAGVVIGDGEVETVTIEKDSTGTLWATFVLNGQVMVSHSSGAPQTWVASYVLPTPAGEANVLPEPEGDESSIVRFDGNKVGIMFSNQNVLDVATQPTNMYWAVHDDGADDHAWTLTTAYSGIRAADDHINLKSLPAGDPDGKVFAALKTSQTSSSQKLTHLLRLKGSTWTSFEFGKVSNDHTRPIVDIDVQNRKLYMFASSPCCNGGAVYYKRSNLSSISFSAFPGLGTPFIQSATDVNINNPTSAKQLLDNTTGLLVLAGDDVTDTYLHNFISLVPPTVPGAPTGATATAGIASANVTWVPPADNGNSPLTGYRVTASPGGAIVDVNGTTTSATVGGLTHGGTYTFTVQAINVIGPGPASTPSNAVTLPVAPGAPTGVMALPANGSAAVGWAAPASNGNSPITGYRVTATPGGATVDVNGMTTSATVTGLTNGTTYTFKVRASNGVGPGPDSAPSNPAMPAAVTTGGYVLDGYGGLHPFGVGNNPKPPAATGGPYWNGWNIARGVALLPNGTGGYVLDGYGGLHPFGVGNNPKPPAATGGPYWNGWDIARGVTLLPNGTGGYVVDGYGGLHPFGVGNNPKPAPPSGGPYWNGWDIVAGTASRLSGGGYVLDGYGGLHRFSTGNGLPPAASGAPYWNGWNIARGASTLLNGAGGYVLDGYGGLHRFRIGGGSAPPAATGGPYWNGWDIARDVALR
jgi:hypothetical protein